MRCPACTQRNSVAARNCKFCGAKFKAKAPEIPVRAIVGVVTVGAVIGVCSFVGSLISGGGKPVPKLKPIAERMAAGPKTPDDAQLMRVELDNAVVGYLEQNGSLSSADLLTKLQSEVPSSAFEVLVFDLPNKIKLVELACVLQPSDYLVVPGKSGTPKVSRINGFSVFDAAKVIDSKPDPCLILLGHSTGDKAGEPQFKASALLESGETTDLTDKVFPVLKGTGSAKFIGTTDDIKIDRSVVSSAKDQKLFDKSVNFKDEPFTTTLKWKNGTYSPSVTLGSSEVGALYAVASSLIDPTDVDIYRQQLSSEVRDKIKSMEDKPVLSPGNFRITKVAKETSSRRRRSRRSAGGDGTGTYILSSGKRGFEVALVKAGRWSVTSLKETEAPAESIASSEPTAEPTPVVEPTPEPVVETAVPVAETPKVVERVIEKPVVKEPVKVATISGTDTSTEKKRDRKSEKKPEKKSEPEKPKQVARDESSSSSSKGYGSETVRKVTMRTGPARQNESVANLGVGVPIRILDQKGPWYKISANGKEGWVYGSYVKRGGSSKPSRERERESVASKPEASEPKPSKRDKKSSKSKPATKTASTKSTTTTATASSVDKSKKSGKYKSQISSSKAHSAPKEASAEPDFVP